MSNKNNIAVMKLQKNIYSIQFFYKTPTTSDIARRRQQIGGIETRTSRNSQDLIILLTNNQESAKYSKYKCRVQRKELNGHLSLSLMHLKWWWNLLKLIALVHMKDNLKIPVNK